MTIDSATTLEEWKAAFKTLAEERTSQHAIIPVGVARIKERCVARIEKQRSQINSNPDPALWRSIPCDIGSAVEYVATNVLVSRLFQETINQYLHLMAIDQADTQKKWADRAAERCRKVARGYVKSEEAIDEIVQNAFLRLLKPLSNQASKPLNDYWRKLPPLGATPEVFVAEGWHVNIVAHSAAKNHLAKVKKFKERLGTESEYSDDASLRVPSSLRDEAPLLALDADDAEIVDECMNTLYLDNTANATSVYFRALQDKDTAAAGRLDRTTQGAVRNRFSRGFETLMECVLVKSSMQFLLHNAGWQEDLENCIAGLEAQDQARCRAWKQAGSRKHAIAALGLSQAQFDHIATDLTKKLAVCMKRRKYKSKTDPTKHAGPLQRFEPQERNTQ